MGGNTSSGSTSWRPVDTSEPGPHHVGCEEVGDRRLGRREYCTVVSLSESPQQAGLLWVGDRRRQGVGDAGRRRTWNDLTANLRGVPAGLYVSRIEASHHDPATAFVCIDGHRNDLFAPYLFVTHDGGSRWSSLAAGLPADGPVQVVREGLENRDLLFVGTEFGLWMSLDAGRTWLKFMQGLPTVAVDDLLLHPREGDLIAGTHGRSVWILDGIQALEQWTPRALRDTLTLFAPRPAWTWYSRPLGAVFGQRTFAALNPPAGAWFDYFLPREIEGGVHLTVRDSANRVVRKLDGPGSVGLNRVAWDLTAGDPKARIQLDEDAGQTPMVPPGHYRVEVASGATRRESTVEVRAVTSADPEP